jgi:soluble lytic murein transglycosylase-like protein
MDSAPKIVASVQRPADRPLNELIAGAAARHEIDPDFVASVVKAESRFNPAAVSPKGARGLMQLMPGTAASLGVGNAFDPASNVEGGTALLRKLLDQYAGNAQKALAAYNAGPERVKQYGGVPPFRETRDYIVRVIEDFNRKKLQQLHSTAEASGK